MNIKALTLSLIAALATSSLAQAEPDAGQGPDQAKRPPFEKILKHLDTDADGRISKAEADAAQRGRLAEHFDKIDADSDGFLTSDEFAKKREAMKAKAEKKRGKWKELDSDESGSLSYEEVEASGNERMRKAFAHIDADGDGQLTPKELRQAKQKKDKGPRPEAE